MHWESEAIILGYKKLGERQAIVQLFAKDKGLYSGVFQNAFSKKNSGKLQVGNLVQITWKARLAEHIGMLTIELIENYSAYFYMDWLRLSLLNSAASILQLCLFEREPHDKLYFLLLDLCMSLADKELQKKQLVQRYCLFEKQLLADIGYGLDLDVCVATGEKEDLKYISPKSAKAVSNKAGEPYKDKLFSLPKFYIYEDNELPNQDLLNALQVQTYFLTKNILQTTGKEMPFARVNLEKMVCEL